MDSRNEAWQVFWCAHLGDVLLEVIPKQEREAHFRKLSRQELATPDGKRRRFSVRTWRRRYQRLAQGGVAGLARRPRSDRGRPRKRQEALLERAAELKREQPERSDQVVNAILRQEFGKQAARSTLYRYWKRVGATRRKLGRVGEKVRCRWSRDHAGALWVGDFEHGPVVMHEGRAVKTHLSAWIDCHSRYIVEARYYVREKLHVLVDSLLRAWARHGASRELYVDNAKIYHAGKLRLATTELNIRLLHRPPRDPAAGGVIERFFQTLQGQLEAEICAAKLFTLERLNAALEAWLSCAYHVQTHSETGQTPLERHEGATRFRRNVNLQAVVGFFHDREKRTVHRDFSDVQIAGRFYLVDARLRGDRVVVQWDPYALDAQKGEVQIFDLQGVYLGVGKRHEREKRSSPPDVAPPREPIVPHYVNALLAQAEERRAQQRQAGVDYRSAERRNRWSFAAFAAQFSRLLGRSEGISALSADEMHILEAFYRRHERLHEGLLREAFSRSETKTIPQILFQLQSLLHERNV